MNIDVERALFEHHFPPPDNVRWSEEHQSYGYIIRNSPNLTQVHRYRSMWRVWKLARATLVVDLDKAPKDMTPFEKGVALAKRGGSVSDIWGACNDDSEMEEVHRGLEYGHILGDGK